MHFLHTWGPEEWHNNRGWQDSSNQNIRRQSSAWIKALVIMSFKHCTALTEFSSYLKSWLTRHQMTSKKSLICHAEIGIIIIHIIELSISYLQFGDQSIGDHVIQTKGLNKDRKQSKHKLPPVWDPNGSLNPWSLNWSLKKRTKGLNKDRKQKVCRTIEAWIPMEGFYS